MYRFLQFITSQLKSPFPDNSDFRKSLIEFIPIALFITFFLYLFKPFRLDGYEGHLFLMCLGYGLVTYIISALYKAFQLFILKIDKELPSWTLGKWILNVLVLLLLISIGNYFYTTGVMESRNFSLRGVLFFVRYTVLVGIFPVVISGLITQLRNQRRNIQTAVELSKKDIHAHHTPVNERIRIVSQNDEDNLILSSEQLLFLEATENYVGVHYLDEQGANKKLVRNTLKALKEELPKSKFLQCHRSFIVNYDLIDQIEGNAQGLKLSMSAIPGRTIPVSRKYIPLLKERIG